MKIITRDELKRRLDIHDDLLLVDVLPAEYFREFHLPGAINVPVAEDFERRIVEVVPNKDRVIVVYCASKDCNASAEAAKKLDALGYTHVFDYAEGKADWKAAGLPIGTEHVAAGT